MHCKQQALKKKSPGKENWKEEILATKEQRQQLHDVVGRRREEKKKTEQRQHQGSGNESHVAGPVKPTSSLRWCIMKAARLHVLPAFGPGPGAL